MEDSQYIFILGMLSSMQGILYDKLGNSPALGTFMRLLGIVAMVFAVCHDLFS